MCGQVPRLTYDHEPSGIEIVINVCYTIGDGPLLMCYYFTWLPGLQDKFRCFKLEFSLHPKLFWELRGKSIIKNKTAILSRKYRSHVRILIYTELALFEPCDQTEP